MEATAYEKLGKEVDQLFFQLREGGACCLFQSHDQSVLPQFERNKTLKQVQMLLLHKRAEPVQSKESN